MSYFFGAKMGLFDLYLKRDHAFACIAELGKVGLVQINDVSDLPYGNRIYSFQIVKCMQMEKKLKKMREDILEMKLRIKPSPVVPETPTLLSLRNLEVEIASPTLHLNIMKANTKDMFNEMENIREMHAGITLAHTLLKDQTEYDICFKAIVGAVPMKNVLYFEKMLWRVSFGNIIFKHTPIDEETLFVKRTHRVYKTAFVFFYQGKTLKKSFDKICSAFRAEIFRCPKTSYARVQLLDYLEKHLDLTHRIIDENEKCRVLFLKSAARRISAWEQRLTHAKSVFMAINICKLSSTHKRLIAECWIPIDSLVEVEAALKRGADASGTPYLPVLVKKKVKDIFPPTYNKTNKFTIAYQNLVDAYGISTYKELNPVPFITITFPYLFAVMFGDLGHGLILLLAGIYMIKYEKKIERNYDEANEIWNIFFSGRYIISMMAIFSIYTGILYNDIFSKQLSIGKTNWSIQNLTIADALSVTTTYMLDPANREFDGTPSIFGIDPIWGLAKNKIIVGNSVKMKLAIIVGFCHMMFGLILGAINTFIHKKRYRFYLQILPQIILMISLIGFLCFLIIFKWLNYKSQLSDNPKTIRWGSSCAPSILILFINMLLFKQNEAQENCSPYLFRGQKIVQFICMAFVIISIPWMLLGVPLYKMYNSKIRKKEIDVSNIWINQSIHTMEFVLGTISHTASYLRLWALSLAHTQLAEVLWKFAIQLSLGAAYKSGVFIGGLILVSTFIMWAIVTVVVLVVMEGLSAFLHTLRLHWVEFQSKFYHGNGTKFHPFHLSDKEMFGQHYELLMEDESIKIAIEKSRSNIKHNLTQI